MKKHTIPSTQKDVSGCRFLKKCFVASNVIPVGVKSRQALAAVAQTERQNQFRLKCDVF